MRILVTGGAGFIGSALVRYLIEHTDHEVLNLDKLTYAGNLQSLQRIADHPRYEFVQADIADQVSVSAMLARFQPHAIMHLAAESHVDRSIDGPADFIHTQIVGTYSLLEASQYVQTLEHRQGLKVACLEEIAFQNGWISREQLLAKACELQKTGYGQYLSQLAEEQP